MPKDTLFLKSRYGHLHKLVPVEELGENAYRYTPAEDWMPLYYTFDGTFDENADVNELTAVDTDGGPFLSVGYPFNAPAVGDVTVKRIYVKKGYGPIVELS